MVSLAREFEQVRKRDGRVVEFDRDRIVNAVLKAMDGTGEGDIKDAEIVADKVCSVLIPSGAFPSIEEIQDQVEEALILLDYPKTAKHYILYRNRRAQLREQQDPIPEHVEEMVRQSRRYFSNSLSEFVYYRSYSRWIIEEGRRETWVETVQRYMDYMRENLEDKLTSEEYEEIHTYILNMWSLPSMRLAWASGPAARNSHVTAYNCSYVAISEIRDFGEILYLLMCGTGVGFSVESYSTQKLPIVEFQDEDRKPEVFLIPDSKEGWADALNKMIEVTYSGGTLLPIYDLLRPAGARLQTMGGRSSGPQPLKDLLEYTQAKILSRQGTRLSEIDVHDIVCKIGEVVVMGGVRRTSLISLSGLDDNDMRDAKAGHFFLKEPQRQLSNNSVAYNQKPTQEEFMEEWLALIKSGSGERGIFNRGSLRQQVPSRRLHTLEDGFLQCGTNPCGEIILKSKQFCNLTEVVARPEDTKKTLAQKIKIATILGTYQSTLTNFSYLSPEWQKNCEQERLLGVSITGQWDSPVARQPDIQRWAKAVAVKTNVEYAARFGVNPSVAVTCVKPSGTVSQLTNASSGMHPRHSPFYIRRIRISASDPLFHMMRDQKFPHHPEVGQTTENATTYVLEFPVASPKDCITKNDLTAIQQLEYWKQVKEYYTEHNPSCTISVGKDEWLDVAHWVYKNWDFIGGLSFLPRDDYVYRLAPFEEITQEEYNKRLEELPDIDFSMIMAYEKDDATQGSKELACVGDRCEI